MKKIELITNDSLLKNIKAAMEKGISKADIEHQRISIIYAGMPKDSAITKDQIKKAIG